MRCSRHDKPNCLHSECRRERDRRTSVADAGSDLTNPASPSYQAVYGSGYTSSGSSSCDSSSGSSSSSSDSGSSSSSSGSSSCD